MAKIIGYVRVSSKSQLDNNSLEQQIGLISNQYPNAIIYKEQFTASTTDRPVLNDIVLNVLKPNDILVCTKLDRFCRTIKEGLQLVESLKSRNIKIHILNMGLIEHTPMGDLIVANLLAFSQFELAMIKERTQTGRAIARTKKDYVEGRPKKYTKKQLDHALSLLTINGGELSYNEVVSITGISKSTLIREVNKRK